MRIPLLDRFWPKVMDTPFGCWHWDGGYNGCGYGVIRDGEKFRYAHRVAYEWANGPIKGGLVVHHRCGNRGCVNPDHLEAVPPSINLALRGWRACVAS